MPPGRSAGDERDDTPSTRSYVDALLRGNLSTDEVASLRAELASRAEEESALLARSYPPPPPPSSAQRIVESPQSGPVTSPRARSPVPPGFHDQRTVVRAYVPPPDVHDQLTVVRSYVPPEEDEGRAEWSYPPERAEDPLRHHPREYEALLAETYLAALGGTAGVPRVAVEPGQLHSLPLEPQAAFVLSRIDGGSSVEDVLDMSGMEPMETLRILYELLQEGAIVVDG